MMSKCCYQKEIFMKKNLGSTHHYLVDNNGEQIAVCLSIKEYQKILRQLEDCRDVRDAEEALREFKKGRSIEDALDELLDDDKN